MGPLSVFGGYTYIESELRGDVANEGNRLPNTPVGNLSVTANLAIFDRLAIGGGVYHQTGRFADPANLISADGYVRIDAFAAYEISDNLAVRFNVKNIGDERYISKLRNPHFAVPGLGRQALISLSAKY